MAADVISYREASIDDLEEIVSLWVENSEYHTDLESRFRYGPDFRMHISTFYRKHLESETSYIVLAHIGDEIVGYCCVLVMDRPPIHLHPKIGFLDGMFVKSTVRRKGVGRHLWKISLDWLKQHDIKAVHLMVASNNLAAIKFWRSVGFDDLLIRMEFGLSTEGG